MIIDSNRMNQFNFDSQLLQKVAGIGSLLSSHLLLEYSTLWKKIGFLQLKLQLIFMQIV